MFKEMINKLHEAMKSTGDRKGLTILHATRACLRGRMHMRIYQKYHSGNPPTFEAPEQVKEWILKEIAIMTDKETRYKWTQPLSAEYRNLCADLLNLPPRAAYVKPESQPQEAKGAA